MFSAWFSHYEKISSAHSVGIKPVADWALGPARAFLIMSGPHPPPPPPPHYHGASHHYSHDDNNCGDNGTVIIVIIHDINDKNKSA